MFYKFLIIIFMIGCACKIANITIIRITKIFFPLIDELSDDKSKNIFLKERIIGKNY